MTAPSGSPSEQSGDGASTRRHAPRWRSVTAVVAVLTAGIAIGAVTGDGGGSSTSAAATTTTTTTPSAAKVYDAILPSLVFIQVERTVAPGDSLGSGVIVNANGQIMTALHVVAGASVIHLAFSDGSETIASLVSTDAANDLATLQPATNPAVVVPATLGSSRGLRVGDPAYSAGNPLGLAGSFSAGVISGLGRTINPSGAAAPLTNLIQFDAAVNPGSSGGPLLDRNGRVVGIVTALANPTADNFFIGIGFAVPIDTPTAGGTRGPNR